MDETQTNWREIPLTRLKIFGNRTVGSLTIAELAELRDNQMACVTESKQRLSADEQALFRALREALIFHGLDAPPALEEEPSASPKQRGFVPISPLQSKSAEISIPPLSPAPLGKPSSGARYQVTDPRGTALRPGQQPEFHGDRRDETSERNAVVVEKMVEQAEQPEQRLAPRKEEPTEPLSQETMESQSPEVFQLQTREDVMWQLQRLGPGPAQDTVLEILEAANAALRQATQIDQTRRLSDFAEVLAVCAQKLDMAQQVQDEAIAYAIRAEHRYNEVVQDARARGEIAASMRGHLKGRKSTGEPNFAAPSPGVPEAQPESFEGSEGNLEKTPPTLDQIGIDKSRAKRLHRWTGISEQELERRIQEKREEGKLTKSAVLSDSATPKKEPKSYQPLLSFLRDFEKHPQNYDAEMLISDPELTTIYERACAKLRGLMEKLASTYDSIRRRG
jgi:hypothetical protein